MMFQKTFGETAPLCGEGQTPASYMSKAEMEDGFHSLRRRQAARKNRSTANHGMFYRKSQVYRHV